MQAVSKEDIAKEIEACERVSEARTRIKNEISKRIIGQEFVVDKFLATLLASGHALLVGVPGLAKTTLIQTLAGCLDLRFSRIQFTPDLMPSDIIGTEVLEEDRASGKRVFKFVPGPVFANIVLADEINRTPPKTQAALLEAMQEMEVTVAGMTYQLERPFHVFATQNPIEQEGTYPLPEAQIDRFMLSVAIEYPSFEDEVKIAKFTSSEALETVQKVLSPSDIISLQGLVLRVPASDHVARLSVTLARRTRPLEPDAPKIVKDYVAYGAGTRAAQHLMLLAKANALLSGHFVVTPEDVRAMAVSCLAHRILMNFHAEADAVTPKTILEQLINQLF
jgi:MoxR-like ATPase